MPPRTRSSIQTFVAASPSAVRARRFSRRFAWAASSTGLGGASAAAFFFSARCERLLIQSSTHCGRAPFIAPGVDA
jgi:hypothetical protein